MNGQAESRVGRVLARRVQPQGRGAATRRHAWGRHVHAPVARGAALWSGSSPAAAPWPSLWTLIPGLFFAIVILAIDASRGTKESRAARLFPRMVALVLQGLGGQTLIDQIDRMISGGGGGPVRDRK